MNLGFDDVTYERVREWLLLALEIAPGPFDEVEMLEKLRNSEWHLITTPNSASVIQLCEFEGEHICNVLVVGGKRNGSLKELMCAYTVLINGLKAAGYTKIVGQPRKEWHRFLIKNYGFKKQKDELIKEL